METELLNHHQWPTNVEPTIATAVADRNDHFYKPERRR